MKTICAWCPTYDRTNPENKHASHGICATCEAKLLVELQAKGTR